MATVLLLPLVWLFGEVRQGAVRSECLQDVPARSLTRLPGTMFARPRSLRELPQFEFLSNEDVTYFLGSFEFWSVMTVTAGAGFLINIAIFLQIKVTTPLSNTISGTAKVRASASALPAPARTHTHIHTLTPMHPSAPARTVPARQPAGVRPDAAGLAHLPKLHHHPREPLDGASAVHRAHAAARSCTQRGGVADGMGAQNGVGILLSLGGSGWYSWIRYKEMVTK